VLSFIKRETQRAKNKHL